MMKMIGQEKFRFSKTFIGIIKGESFMGKKKMLSSDEKLIIESVNEAPDYFDTYMEMTTVENVGKRLSELCKENKEETYQLIYNDGEEHILAICHNLDCELRRSPFVYKGKETLKMVLSHEAIRPWRFRNHKKFLFDYSGYEHPFIGAGITILALVLTVIPATVFFIIQLRNFIKNIRKK